MVVDTGDQVEPQPKTLPAISVAVGNDSETLQCADNMLVQNTLTGHHTVEPLVLRRQRLLLAPLLWQQTVGMDFGDSKIPRIRNGADGRIHEQAGFLVQAKIMLAAFGETGADNLPRWLGHHHLGFYRVPLFLARVVPFLFFLGRWTGVSVASTRITSILFELAANAFLPGNANSPDLTNVSSTRRIT